MVVFLVLAVRLDCSSGKREQCVEVCTVAGGDWRLLEHVSNAPACRLVAQGNQDAKKQTSISFPRSQEREGDLHTSVRLVGGPKQTNIGSCMWRV